LANYVFLIAYTPTSPRNPTLLSVAIHLVLEQLLKVCIMWKISAKYQIKNVRQLEPLDSRTKITINNPYHLSPTLIRPYHLKSGERIRRLGYEYLSPYLDLTLPLRKRGRLRSSEQSVVVI